VAPRNGIGSIAVNICNLINRSRPSGLAWCAFIGCWAFTFDPGRALITGKCEDIGKVKVPALRGLAGRAPYFHNGSAADLAAVVSFYQRRFFTFSLNAQQETDLTNFLNSL
jgi:hypothetical protein